MVKRIERQLELTNSRTFTRLDEVLALPMFVVSVLFLFGAGAFLHLAEGDVSSPLGFHIAVFLSLLYLVLLIETLTHRLIGTNNMRQHWLILLFPVMRICPRDHVDGSHTWIPMLGWRESSDALEDCLARAFSWPMIIIALSVLPVVAIEFFYGEWVAQNELGQLAINVCSGLIWIAFVFEFVIMFSVVNQRFQYCKKNWIDLAVILLPLVTVMGAARMGRLMKLNQLSRTAKIYRIRGLAIRVWRAVVALDVLDSILRLDPNRRVEKLRRRIEERESQLERLRCQLGKLESAVASQGLDCCLPSKREFAQNGRRASGWVTGGFRGSAKNDLEIMFVTPWLHQPHYF